MFAQLVDENEEWLREQARCNDGTGNLVTLFFSEQLDDIARAKPICAERPAQTSGLVSTLARRQPYRVTAGQRLSKGKVRAYKRPRGRPPKNAQPLSA